MFLLPILAQLTIELGEVLTIGGFTAAATAGVYGIVSSHANDVNEKYEKIQEMMSSIDSRLSRLEYRIDSLEKTNQDLEDHIVTLRERVSDVESRAKVFDAYLHIRGIDANSI